MIAKVPGPLAVGPRVADWFRVSKDGALTAMTGRVELGQGNQTALLQMAADELGISPTDLDIEMARTDRTVNEGYTAGSMSVSDGGVALRWAASALRSLLCDAAAQRLGADAATLDIQDGQICRGGRKTGLTIADVVADISFDADVQDHLRLRTPEARWQNGRDIARIDLRERIVGAPFVHDVDVQDMLHGAPLHPPSATARLDTIDLEAIRARPGVVDVVRDGSYIGIIARSAFEAARAADLSRGNVSWTETSTPPNDALTSIAASEADADLIFEASDDANVEGERFETTVSRPYLSHGSIGPSAALARWDGEAVTVWTHSQGVFQLRTAMALALRIDESLITVIHQPGSGCYGHNGADDAAFDAVLMARATPGQTVRVVWSRLDEFRTAPLGPGMVTRATAVVGANDRIRQIDVIVNSPPHANRPGANGAVNLRAAGYLADPTQPTPSKDLPLLRGGGADRNAIPGYDIPNVRVQKRLVHLPFRSSSLRSLGAFTNVFALETLMDDMARARGIDPAEFRRAHLSDPRSKAVIDAVMASTEARRAEPGAEGCGWGMGFARYKNTSGYCAVVARVEAGDDLRVTDAYCAADIGEVISPDGARNQIEGGIVQGTSWTVTEAVAFESAMVAAESWLDYPILRFSEVPRVHVELLDRPDSPPLGCGEIAQAPTAAAIGNAVMDALGVRVRNLPITRDAIVAALAS